MKTVLVCMQTELYHQTVIHVLRPRSELRRHSLHGTDDLLYGTFSMFRTLPIV